MNTLDPRIALPSLPTTCLLLAVALTPPAGAEKSADPETLTAALKGGKPYVNLRYRFENVEEDASTKDAHASTLRSVLGWESADYKGWSVFGEAENVTSVGNDLYNNRGAGSLANGVTDRPVVADPEITEINQAGLRFRSEDWAIVAGRQEMVLGDARFVGNVGWRQNHQSFDGVRIDNESLERARFGYAFVDRVQRIFGDSLDLSAHLLNATLEAGMVGKVTVYGYLLDYRDTGAAGNSTATWGAELAGKRPLRDTISLLYEVEYARQSDFADNPANIDAGYSFVMLGAAWPKITARVGWETLEGAPGEGRFTTPLATLHKFNGWADKFLATPATGLEDRYLQLDGKVRSFEWSARFHDFDAESSGASYGGELDLQLLYRTSAGVVLGIGGFLYDADTFSTDTEKWALWATYSF